MNGDASIRNRHKLKLTITGFRLERLGFSLWVVAFLALKMGPVQREREGENEPPNRRVRPAFRSQAKPGGNRPQPKGVGALSEELDWPNNACIRVRSGIGKWIEQGDAMQSALTSLWEDADLHIEETVLRVG